MSEEGCWIRPRSASPLAVPIYYLSLTPPFSRSVAAIHIGAISPCHQRLTVLASRTWAVDALAVHFRDRGPDAGPDCAANISGGIWQDREEPLSETRSKKGCYRAAYGRGIPLFLASLCTCSTSPIDTPSQDWFGWIPWSNHHVLVSLQSDQPPGTTTHYKCCAETSDCKPYRAP